MPAPPREGNGSTQCPAIWQFVKRETRAYTSAESSAESSPDHVRSPDHGDHLRSFPYNHGTPMRNRLFRASAALTFLLWVAPALAAGAPAAKKPAPKRDLKKDIEAVLSQPPLVRAHWGIDV